ncbi:MAG: VWA domain-containing protein, partial [Acidobacteriaceae bacterium]
MRQTTSRLLLLSLAATLPPFAASAQSASPTPTAAANPITLDITVTTPGHRPIRNLQPSDFRLTDNGVPQTLHTLTEHPSPTPPPPPPALPALPPGTFTDYTPLPPNAPLTILLLDALNTPTKNHTFFRQQLQQYVEQASPGAPIAILGLANRLFLLQDFASDPAILRMAVEHMLIPRSPALLDRSLETHGQPPPNLASSPSPTDIAANLRQFESGIGSLETGFRQQFTLDALNTLAHYLSGFPGRKTLIWVSSSFPFSILPETPQPKSPTPEPSTTEELQQTIDLLARAQVSIDPVDAAALTPQPSSPPASAQRASMRQLAA